MMSLPWWLIFWSRPGPACLSLYEIPSTCLCSASCITSHSLCSYNEIIWQISEMGYLLKILGRPNSWSWGNLIHVSFSFTQYRTITGVFVINSPKAFDMMYPVQELICLHTKCYTCNIPQPTTCFMFLGHTAVWKPKLQIQDLICNLFHQFTSICSRWL